MKLELRRRDEPELMDQPGHDSAVLAGTVDDLRRVNRWLGGTRLTLRAFERLTMDLPTGAELSVVDVGAGGADVAVAIVEWARSRKLRPRVVATDVSREMLALAERRRVEGLETALADARDLPFADRTFDLSTCSLVLHHFGPDEAVTVLRELARVCRRGVVVNDLVRGWLGYGGAWIAGRVATRNPITRHDAPVSVRRAYTRAELADLARRAGLEAVRFDGFLFYRVAMSWQR